MNIDFILAIIALIVVTIHSFIDIFLRIIWPKWLAPKPHIDYLADHYFISENLAGHDTLIFNNGKGTAHNIDFYFELKAPYKILSIVSNPSADIDKGKAGETNWHANWRALPPKNFISIRILSEANKQDPTSVFPHEVKLSDKDKIISRIYAPS